MFQVFALSSFLQSRMELAASLEKLTIEGTVVPDNVSEPSDSEDESDYRVGGYHPVKIGETFNEGRYRILQKLGWGHFSTVWLGFDAEKKEHCAIKVQKSDTQYFNAAEDELKILRALKKKSKKSAKPLVELLDNFEHIGPHGRHMCLTFEVLSKNLLSLVKRYDYKGVPVPMIQVIARQLLQALDFIHEDCGIIHTDIKPENILFTQHLKEKAALQEDAQRAVLEMERLKKQDEAINNSAFAAIGSVYKPDPKLTFASGNIKLVDFGNACYTHHQFTDDIQTRQYRAPEVILGCGYDVKADIWSCACLLFELATGDFLFDPHGGEDYDRDEDHLALIMELLGPVPIFIREKAEFAEEFFNERGELLHIPRLNFWSLRDILREKYKLTGGEAECITSFLMPMLYYDPDHRASAKQLLEHPFVNGANFEDELMEAPLIGQKRKSSLLHTMVPEMEAPGEYLPGMTGNTTSNATQTDRQDGSRQDGSSE